MRRLSRLLRPLQTNERPLSSHANARRSIDYSLFLFTRFQKEVRAGQACRDAVIMMLATSGKIVLVSGLTLLLCFLMMLILPVSLISSMPVCHSICLSFDLF